ncbi:hypothetical protein EV197_2533 [Aquimarina brevivitae]|uniref:Uncharacterized protein n=2 Tax=Aquimarina brevivitae TaxID=323412 RepID=A0A4Q7P5F8_9FLAO|nr:hypothetical protein EV197_2533 [Aquimarina brevivitae]
MKKLTSFVFIVLLAIASCTNEENLSLTANPEPMQNRSAFGIDGLNRNYLSDIALLADGISGINGISWDDIEPNPPQNGVHDYRLTSEMIELNSALQSNSRKLQLNFRLSSNWAIQRDPNQPVTNPEDGSREGGILGVNPTHENDLVAVIEHILSNLNIEVLQIGSEAENEWLDASAYVHALAIIYQTAKRIQPDITIMIFGFNPANYFTHPDRFNTQLITNKLNFVTKVLELGAPYFDVFSFHASRELEAIEPTVTWIKEQMQSYGYTKPVWVDDMYSAPWLDPVYGSQNDRELYNQLISEEPQAIAMFDSLQAGYMIKKLTVGFACGIEKIFVSTDVDFEAYYIPNWRYVGLLKSSGQRKPAYYNLKLLIDKTSGFERVNSIGNGLFEFKFFNNNSIYVYWSEGNSTDVLTALQANSYTIHQFAYHINEAPNSSVVTSLENINFDSNPVLIELNE